MWITCSASCSRKDAINFPGMEITLALGFARLALRDTMPAHPARHFSQTTCSTLI